MDELHKLDRRTLMQSVALLIGAATVPSLAGCKAILAGDDALDAGRMTLLTAIADTIIPVTDTPGAVAAGVPKLLAGMLRDWASAAHRAELIGAIDEIGALDKAGFATLVPARRTALLTAHDKAAVQPGPPPKVKLSGIAAMLAGPPVANPAYVRLKGLIINLYYSSEIASTKELIFEAVPGKFVASLKVTPQTRPFAGVGGLF